MKIVVGIIAVATTIRILISFALLSDGSNILDRALGQGALNALGAAILDPVQTWDHLGEACFWLESSSAPLWTDLGDSGGYDSAVVGGYSTIYAPGTRIVAPPLVVAFLGEALVCPTRSPFLRVIRQLLLMLADAIGAFCMYHIGKRIFELEGKNNEAEMERHTELSEKNDEKCNNNLVVPGILRPERGWIVGLQSKIFPTEESLIEENEAKLVNGSSSDEQEQNEDKNGDGSTDIGMTCHSPLEREPILTLDQLPIITALVYFCNPASMLANATGSTRTLWDTLLLLSFYYATLPPMGETKEGIPVKISSVTKASLCLAIATYADAGYGVFLLPILVWRGLLGDTLNATSDTRSQHMDWKVLLVLFLVYYGGLHYLASVLVGGTLCAYWKVMVQTMLPNVAFVQQDESGSVSGPSMGLHWYMFVQVFDRFRPYFTVFVSGIPAMFAIPLITRLHRYPSVLAATLQLLWAIFRPTTTVHTLVLGLHLAMLNPRTIVRMRNPALISLFALPVPILLFVTFHRMWLVTGNGNPNYIYFQCFAYGAMVTIITMEFVSATVKRDKVRRMVESGKINDILEKKEAVDVQKKQGEIAEEDSEERNGSAEKKDSADSGKMPDTRDDTGSKPEPNVVFL